MWVIISSDGDIDYTDVYGPFESEEEADAYGAELPADDGDIAYRVVPLFPTSALDTILAKEVSENEEDERSNLVPDVSLSPNALLTANDQKEEDLQADLNDQKLDSILDLLANANLSGPEEQIEAIRLFEALFPEEK